MTDEAKQARRDYYKELRMRNPEKSRERQRERYYQDPEKARRYQREYYAKNRDKIREIHARYWEKKAQENAAKASETDSNTAGGNAE